MEWLLTLFAMLSAVSGALNGVRGEETQLHRAEAASQVQMVAAVAQTAIAVALPHVPVVAPLSAELPVLPRVQRIASIPLYADRLIE